MSIGHITSAAVKYSWKIIKKNQLLFQSRISFSTFPLYRFQYVGIVWNVARNPYRYALHGLVVNIRIFDVARNVLRRGFSVTPKEMSADYQIKVHKINPDQMVSPL